MNVILHFMTLYKYNIDIDYHHIKNKNDERHTKKGKYSNKSSEYNTTFNDTYRLCKHNIGIDYHHNRNKDKERHRKKGKSSNKISECNNIFEDTYLLYKYILV